MRTKNAKFIALKQALAFSIDLSIVSFPLIVAPSLEILPFFALIWYLYIPLSEYYFSKTIGMKLVGTKIMCANDMQSHIDLGTAFRRQIARISMMWGIAGWLFLFAGKQYVSDYVVIDGSYSSIYTKQDGWIKTHKKNEYKVIFFVLLLMIFFSMIKELL